MGIQSTNPQKLNQPTNIFVQKLQRAKQLLLHLLTSNSKKLVGLR